MSHKKFGPDRFSRFDVYWIQTNRQTDKPNLYIDILRTIKLWNRKTTRRAIFLIVNLTIDRLVKLPSKRVIKVDLN